MVYVLDKDGHPLMPTENHAKVRVLLKSGMALDEEAETLYKLITDQTFHTKSLRPHGKWILVDPLGDGHKAYMCSNCKGGDYYFEPSMAFCPLCGSDNREVKNGSNKEF